MNSYDASHLTKAIEEISDKMPDVGDIGALLGDIFGVLDGHGEVLEGIHEQLTQISNTLARTMGREQTRFIVISRLHEGTTPERDEWRRELFSVASISRVEARDPEGGAYINGFKVRESFDEVFNMINAGAYVPPF